MMLLQVDKQLGASCPELTRNGARGGSSGRSSAEGERESLGGTGVTHDWSISKRIVDRSPLPVFLAGGLSVENVKEAIDAVSPFGVDVCSNLRPSGSLDSGRLQHFVTHALA